MPVDVRKACVSRNYRPNKTDIFGVWVFFRESKAWARVSTSHINLIPLDRLGNLKGLETNPTSTLNEPANCHRVNLWKSFSTWLLMNSMYSRLSPNLTFEPTRQNKTWNGLNGFWLLWFLGIRNWDFQFNHLEHQIKYSRLDCILGQIV